MVLQLVHPKRVADMPFVFPVPDFKGTEIARLRNQEPERPVHIFYRLVGIDHLFKIQLLQDFIIHRHRIQIVRCIIILLIAGLYTNGFIIMIQLHHIAQGLNAFVIRFYNIAHPDFVKFDHNACTLNYEYKKIIPKRMLKKNFALIAFFIAVSPFKNLYAQPVSRDSVNAILKSSPAFTIYKDNYFILGTAVNTTPTKENSDLKYQISIKQKLTNAILPFNTYLFLTYTQRSFWNVFEKSSPFRETNYNPGVGLGKLLFKDQDLLGIAVLSLEHESNGRDSTQSRSWNFLALSYLGSFSSRFKIYAKTWLPFGYKDDNPDLPEYIGYGEAKLTWIIEPHKWMLDVTGRKGTHGWNGSLMSELMYKPGQRGNEYLMIQWFRGDDESLIHYNESVSRVRIGLLIKASNLGFY